MRTEAAPDDVVGLVTFQDYERPWYAHGEWRLARSRLPWWCSHRLGFRVTGMLRKALPRP